MVAATQISRCRGNFGMETVQGRFLPQDCRLLLPGPEEEDRACGITALGNEELLTDFEIVASRNALARLV